jgi:uncharacterized repeat protein (TIGR03803 family)
MEELVPDRFRLFRNTFLGSVFLASLFTPAGAHETGVAQSGSKYSVLYNFPGAPAGSFGGNEVTPDSSGNIYGTTIFGGANNYGSVFRLASDGSESVLHSFSEGDSPDAPVLILPNGNMIGTSGGTIWQIASDGTFSVLHSFTVDDGFSPSGKLVQDKDGNLYGTCQLGGEHNNGTVFEYTAAGQFTVLHRFGGDDGLSPTRGVVIDNKGNLYGATSFGGTTDQGTVYKIARDDTFSSLYSFSGGADGEMPIGGLAIDEKGNLYGNTFGDGGGTIFKITPKGTLTTIYTFTGGINLTDPDGDVLLAGKTLYGSASAGGAYGLGGLYEFSLKGTEKTLADFSDANGNSLSDGVTLWGKFFYGSTASGGSSENGVVFRVKK